ncbi:hypothetical protein [Paenibacillus riograndensis]|uniref:Uncharacterized protein n=1 Tax=Paenibacillus riograndensis SBR5 TaxID=1073571 RepID=A0A0E4H7X1_9BACL|nr:hypothetical protein [Paenibacillus riograndensis]CQR52313.1 hypothetical protein PRIO_0744 [Paenibacillus riograndensis SBR5]
MGWSRVPIRGMQNVYNDEAKQIDEQILELFRQRKAVSGGKGLFPDTETIEEWATRFELQPDEITFILSSLNEARPRRKFWEEPGVLRGVLPIMQTTLQDDVEYTLTHALQHEKLSIVTLEIKYLKETVGQVSINPLLTLAVVGDTDYEIDGYGARGGGAHFHMQFMVWPPLPEDLSFVEFSLVPASNRFMCPIREEVFLDKQIDFH